MDTNVSRGGRLSAHYALIQCIYNMGYCCIMSFASVFLLARGFSNAEVGVTLTIASALAIVTQPFLANFADRARHVALRTIVATILGAMALISLLLLAAPAALLPTALLYVLLYCLQSIQQSLVTSLAIEHINAGASLNFSLARGIGSFGFAVLSLAMGFLVDSYGSWVVMALNIAIGLVGIALVASFPRLAAAPDAPGAARASGLREFARKNRRFMGVVVSIALMFFSHILINTYTIQIVRHVGGSGAEMGAATALAGFLELPAMALFPLLHRRIGSASLIMKLSGVAIVLKGLMTLLAPSMPWIYAAQCLQFFAFAMFVPASVFYVNDVIGDADKVKGQAAMGMALGIGAMIGNFAGGFMLDLRGVPFMLAVGLGVSLVGLALVLLIDGWRRPRSAGLVVG